MNLYLALVAIFILGVLVYAFFIEPRQLRVRDEVVPVNPNVLHDRLRILFVSDLHLGWATSKKLLKAKLDSIHKAHEKEHFQVVIFGGDYLDLSPRYLPILKEVLADFKTLRLPLFGVIGNHDYHYVSVKGEEVLEALQEAGVRVLQNKAELLTIGKEELVIVGLDDLEKSPEYNPSTKPLTPAEYRERARILDWYHPFDRFHPHHARVLVSHNPDAVYMQGTARPDVVLAGHTHGGQFAPLDWLARWLYRLGVLPKSSFLGWAGRLYKQGTTLLVSRGFASSVLPARFLRPPEVLAVTLEPAEIPRHLIIGFSGKPRSGKDTAARVVQTVFPGIKVVGFSDAIRDEFDAQNGTNTRLSEKEKDRHRAQIQEFGAGKVKEDAEYWIKRVLKHQPPMLITGVRRINEAKAIQAAGGILIRIEISEKTQRERVGDELYEANKHHDNETQLDNYPDWDYVITNDGTEDEFVQKIRELVEKLT